MLFRYELPRKSTEQILFYPRNTHTNSYQNCGIYLNKFLMVRRNIQQKCLEKKQNSNY